MKSWRTYPRWLRWLVILVILSASFIALDMYIVYLAIQRAAERETQQMTEPQ